MGCKMKKGQVTLFVIISIVIVVAILVVIFLREDIKKVFDPKLDLQTEIQKCVRLTIEDTLPLILKGAGELESSKTIKYQGKEYPYLCYQEGDYSLCYNLHPQLTETTAELIMETTFESVESCFDLALEDVKKKRYTVNEENINYSVSIIPGSILVTLLKPIILSKENSTQTYEDFSFEVYSEIYELFHLVRRIINEESQYCDFNVQGYSLLYQDYNITRTIYDYSKLYNIRAKNSNDEIKFAVRGCVMP